MRPLAPDLRPALEDLFADSFYVRKASRRQGIRTVLIAEAPEMARRAGAPALEAYPLDRNLSSSATSTGVVSTFERTGFETVARLAPARPLMRYDLRAPGR